MSSDTYQSLLRPALFRLSAKQAHEAAFGAMAVSEHVLAVRSLVEATFGRYCHAGARELMGLTFRNPVGIAGGFDKDGRRPFSLAALGFGFLELGTVTAIGQEANPEPNLFRLPADGALINRLGFPNRGAKALASRLRALGRPEIPLAISIGKSRVVLVDEPDAVFADYEQSFNTVAPLADFVIINISSPNTKNLRSIQKADLAKGLLERLQKANAKRPAERPILVKVAPDMAEDDYLALLGVIKELGLAGVVATNTTIKRDGLKTPNAEVNACGAGGLSGPPLKERSRAFVRTARAELGPEKVVIGVGGIQTGADAEAMLEAGADLIQLYTGFIYEGPAVVRKICSHLQQNPSG